MRWNQYQSFTVLTVCWLFTHLSTAFALIDFVDNPSQKNSNGNQLIYRGLSRSEIMNSSPIKIRNPDLFYGSGFQTEISPDINIPEKIKRSGYYNRPIRNDFFLRNGRAVQEIVGFNKPAKQSGKGYNRDASIQITNFLNTPESLTYYFNLRT